MIAINKAFEYYGLKEIVGKEHEPLIIKFFDFIGHSWIDDDETPWCATFVNYCLKMAGEAMTGKLNARSFLDYGEEVKQPKFGDIVVLWRGDRNGWQGHVGFFVKQDDKGIYVLGGNQSNEVNITIYKNERLLSYRRV